jgi:hypothetical protein
MASTIASEKRSCLKFVAAFCVNFFVANDGKLVGPRRDEDENGVAMAGFVHAGFLEPLLGRFERIAAQFAALEIDADLARAARLLFANRFHDSIVLEFIEEFFRAHPLPATAGSSSTEAATSAAKSTTTTEAPAPARAPATP